MHRQNSSSRQRPEGKGTVRLGAVGGLLCGVGGGVREKDREKKEPVRARE